MDEAGAVASQPGGLPGAGPHEKPKNENKKGKSYEAVSGTEKTVNELVNEHEKVNEKKVGTGLVGVKGEYIY